MFLLLMGTFQETSRGEHLVKVHGGYTRLL